MEIKLIESIEGEQIFEYKFPDFLNQNNKAGKSADDFEVLQVLGSGTFGKVLKVKSKKNQEIYAMKRVEKEKLKDYEKYFRNEEIILSKLQSPLVCRCYTTFEDDDYIYYLMEYINNGDLKSYFDPKKSFMSQIPEEKLLDIFFKSMSGLLYIHNKGLIHRDIKLENLFFDDNFNIKIGDFNISAAINIESAENFTNDFNQMDQMISRNSYGGTPGYMAPEVNEKDDNKRKYDQKADIFSMGVSFFELAYGHMPFYMKKEERNKYYSKNLYSKEINEIIDNMIQEEPENRYTTYDAYSKIKILYAKKYVKNSAVESALNCFYNFQNFKNFFSNYNNIKLLLIKKESNNPFDDNKFEMGFSVIKLIQSLNGDDEDLKKSNLFDLRKNMGNYGLNLEYNEEIKMEKFIFYFLKILNSILNEVVTDEKKEKTKEEVNEELEELKYLSPNYLFKNGDEEVIFRKIIEVYNKRILSLISRNFINFIKTKKKCMLCFNESNSFSMINYIPFNVNILTKNYNNNNLHIKDGFKYLLNDEKSFNEQKGIECQICGKITIHKESKSFYHTSKNLIIVFNRGKNCENKAFIDFDDKLILNEEVERYLGIWYQLIGVIEVDEDGNYLSFTRNENNLWCYNGYKKNVMKLEVIKGIGTIVALFYYCYNDNLTLQSNSFFNHPFNMNQFTFPNAF